jgi:hypothetical protein
MPASRVNPYRVKQHFSYTAKELATCLGVHPNTVRYWQRNGLEPIDTLRPILFQGGAVREFLAKRKADRKRPCPQGTLFCMRCREPRAPALGMVEYVPANATRGNLRALCEHCEGWINRNARLADLKAIMPHCTVQITERPFSLSG